MSSVIGVVTFSSSGLFEKLLRGRVQQFWDVVVGIKDAFVEHVLYVVNGARCAGRLACGVDFLKCEVDQFCDNGFFWVAGITHRLG